MDKTGTTFRLAALVLAAALVAALSGCGGAKRNETAPIADEFLTTEELYQKGREYLANSELRRRLCPRNRWPDYRGRPVPVQLALFRFFYCANPLPATIDLSQA